MNLSFFTIVDRHYENKQNDKEGNCGYCQIMIKFAIEIDRNDRVEEVEEVWKGKMETWSISKVESKEEEEGGKKERKYAIHLLSGSR